MSDDLTVRDHIWHYAYRHWYDNKAAGHTARTKAWGILADAIIKVLWDAPARLRRTP